MFIKVCGMREPENIRYVEMLDVDCMGFIFYARSPRYVTEKSEYVEAIGNCKKNKAGVFVKEPLEGMLEKARLFRLNTIQLHGNETPDLCDELRQRGYAVTKAFSIASSADFRQTEKYRSVCNLFLFDTKCAGYGGSGKRFDWSLLGAYQGETPFLLSGGITPDCIEAIKCLRHPQFAGLDLNSGFEISPAMKDAGKIKEFIFKLKTEN